MSFASIVNAVSVGRASCTRLSHHAARSVISIHQHRHQSTKADINKVGFIGLGNMGGFMAMNLVKSGLQLSVYDISDEACARLQEMGSTVAKSPAEAADGVDAVITMLPSSPHVNAVYTGKDGILESLSAGTICVDSSTIDPDMSKTVGAATIAKGGTFVDGPVSGGVGAAEAGTLTFMVGGTQEHFDASHGLLSIMGGNIVHCGDLGTGQVAKLCNNMMLGISMIGASETMNLGVKQGMDPKLLANILSTSTGRCWSLDTYNPCPGVFDSVPASRGYTGGFGSALMLKDLGLAQDAAAASNSATPLGTLAQIVYQKMTDEGYGEKDFSSAYEWLSKQNN